MVGSLWLVADTRGLPRKRPRSHTLPCSRRALCHRLECTVAGVAAIAVATVVLPEVVVQFAHRRLLLGDGGEGVSGSESIVAIVSSAAARRATSRSTTSRLSFPGLRSLPLLGFLRMLLSLRVTW
jgi:hypothetical protein